MLRLAECLQVPGLRRKAGYRRACAIQNSIAVGTTVRAKARALGLGWDPFRRDGGRIPYFPGRQPALLLLSS